MNEINIRSGAKNQGYRRRSVKHRLCEGICRMTVFGMRSNPIRRSQGSRASVTRSFTLLSPVIATLTLISAHTFVTTREILQEHTSLAIAIERVQA